MSGNGWKWLEMAGNGWKRLPDGSSTTRFHGLVYNNIGLLALIIGYQYCQIRSCMSCFIFDLLFLIFYIYWRFFGILSALIFIEDHNLFCPTKLLFSKNIPRHVVLALNILGQVLANPGFG